MLSESEGAGRTPSGAFAPALVPSRFNFWATLSPSRHLLFNGLTAALYELDDEECESAKALLKGEHDAGSPGTVELAAALEEGGFLIPAPCDEVGALLAANRLACDHPASLDLMVVPTYECNFRCTYCHIHFARGRMTADVERAVLRFITRQLHSFAVLNLTWFGGEPLLCTDTVARMSALVSGAAGAVQVPARCMVATNGLLLTPETAARLCDAGAPYFHVTVDGPAAHHDLLRPTAAGGPSQLQIMSNIVAVLDRVPAAEVTLRMNATRHNVEALPAVFEQIPRSLRPRVKVAVMLVRGGDPPDAELRAHVCHVMRGALEAGYACNDAALPVGRATHCDADSRTSFEIGPEGSLYKCSPSAMKPDVCVGRLDPDGTPHFNRRYEEWHGAPEVRPECVSCQYLCFCNGGCRITRLKPSDDLSCQHEFADIEALIINRYLAATALRP